jgi:hypothetical protein
MGTIASIDGTNLMVKTADGKQTMVMMDAKTLGTRARNPGPYSPVPSPESRV